MNAPKSDKTHICLGAFAGAHGVKGDAKIKTFTETPKGIADYGPVTTEDGARTFTLSIVKVLSDGFVIARAPELKSREDAQALKAARLYVDRAALPAPDEDEFYLDDLVGLKAFDENGAPLGEVRAVYNFGAGDLLELGDIPDVKGVRLVPFTKEAVPAVDINAGRVTVSRAFLDLEDEPVLKNEDGQLVSNDVDVDLDAMRQEDS
ncbi:ribosome maturation factor RimM [Hyphococcus luteus]|uniref:Ribosome maturation factor RimM n=1 Tax=Hyphococcus luteus TaxID=2058213 RepID=A0A2S7K6C1_9PROT|nr:ribosome maturation factor RimM [Marinicaulis flavus]PQA88008.1 16S rRNA processing protein RimM [Marinicaulis flavus]